MVGPQENERKAFIITQQHIVGRAIALDELRFQEQRLSLAIGCHNGHAARLGDHAAQTIGQPVYLRIIGYAVFKCFRLADIKDITARIIHAVDTRFGRQRFDHIADRRHPGLKIRLVRPTNGVGCTLFVKAIGRIWVGHKDEIEPISSTRPTGWGDIRCN